LGILTLRQSGQIGTGWSLCAGPAEAAMAVIVVTRLRLRDPAFFDEFFASAVAVTEQATNSEGNLGADVLAEANNTYWTRTAWKERDLMHAFVGSEPHLTIMGRLDDWCDEATFVDWEQASADLPDWQDGYGHIIANGQAASLANATDAHHARDFPAPIVSS
jgi:hypothetical protein